MSLQLGRDLPRPGGEPGSPDPNGAGYSPEKRVTGAGTGIPGLHKAGRGRGRVKGPPTRPDPVYI